MQTAFAVSLVLGFKNAVECLYAVAFSAEEWHLAIVKSIFSVVLLLTTMRFFWALGNIRRFIERNLEMLRATRRYVISIHFFILLAHAFCLYLLSKYTLDLSNAIPLATAMRLLTFGYASFLALNGSWLFMLVLGQEDKKPESVWIKNNYICAAAACAIYISVSYFNPFLAFLVASVIYLWNSVYDLIKTSSAYVWVDDDIASHGGAEQAGTGQPATRSESKSEGGDKPQPESEGRSR